MKKIDEILNGTKEQYPSLISKLSNILEPFALLAVGKMPVYLGRIVEEIGAKQRSDCKAFILLIDGIEVAHIDIERMEASVFDGETFPLSIEDTESVENVIKALKNCQGTDRNPIKDIINDMPKELQSLIEAVMMASKFRREDN